MKQEDTNLKLCYQLLNYLPKKQQQGIFLISNNADPIQEQVLKSLGFDIREGSAIKPSNFHMRQYEKQTIISLPSNILRPDTNEKKIIIYFLIRSFSKCKFVLVVTDGEAYQMGLITIKEIFQCITHLFQSKKLIHSIGFVVSNQSKGRLSQNYVEQIFEKYGFQQPNISIAQRKQLIFALIKDIHSHKKLTILTKDKQQTKNNLKQFFNKISWFQLKEISLEEKLLTAKIKVSCPWANQFTSLMKNLLSLFQNKSQKYAAIDDGCKIESKIKNIPLVNMLNLFTSFVLQLQMHDVSMQNSTKTYYKRLITMFVNCEVIPKQEVLLQGMIELWDRICSQEDTQPLLNLIKLDQSICTYCRVNDFINNFLNALLGMIFAAIEQQIKGKKQLQTSVIEVLRKQHNTLRQFFVDKKFTQLILLFKNQRIKKKAAKSKAQLNYLALRSNPTLQNFKAFFHSAQNSTLLQKNIVVTVYDMLAQELYRKKKYDQAIACYRKGNYLENNMDIFKIFLEMRVSQNYVKIMSKAQFIAKNSLIMAYVSQLIACSKQEQLQSFIYVCLNKCNLFSLDDNMRNKFKAVLFRLNSFQKNKNTQILTDSIVDRRIQIDEKHLMTVWDVLK